MEKRKEERPKKKKKNGRKAHLIIKVFRDNIGNLKNTPTKIQVLSKKGTGKRVGKPLALSEKKKQTGEHVQKTWPMGESKRED